MGETASFKKKILQKPTWKHVSKQKKKACN